jgi:hypothetical protein
MDLDVKQQSIIAAADLVSSCYSVLNENQIQSILRSFVDRLGHELTRETALKGITLVALNETSISISHSRKEMPVIPLNGLHENVSGILDLLHKN